MRQIMSVNVTVIYVVVLLRTVCTKLDTNVVREVRRISQSRFRMQRLFVSDLVIINSDLIQIQRKRGRDDGVDLIDHNLDVSRFGLTLFKTKLSHPDQTRIASSSPQICGWFEFSYFLWFVDKGVSVTPLHGYTGFLFGARHLWHLMWHGCVWWNAV